ncbi:MAG: aminoglycoside adenylyltransferase domain-containing protein [Candidatus Dormibacteria bacterium]
MDVDSRIILAGGPGLGSFLALMVSSWRSALGRNLAGVYVHGSLSTGAFNLRTSDIDIVTTTRMLTDAGANERIREVHAAMHGWGDDQWADRLQVLFVPARMLGRSGVPPIAVLELHPDDGFKIRPLGSDFVIQKRILREHGITLFGPRIKRIVAPATTGELRDAQAANLREWWLPQIEFPGRFLEPLYQVYAVLTMCRALCLLATGEVVTKPEAAAWALHVPYLEAWHPLIRSATAYPGGAQPDQRMATLDFIRFTLEEAGIGHTPPSS